MSAPPAAAFTITVIDAVDARLAGHDGGVYTSPPQRLTSALALVALLLGGPASDPERRHWTRAIAGGRRTITLSEVRPAAAENR